MIWLSFLLALISAGNVDRGITGDIQPVEGWGAVSRDDYVEPLGLRDVYIGAASQSSFHLLLPAQTALVLRCDADAQTLADTLAPDYGLTANAEYDLGHCLTYSYEEIGSKSAIKFAPGKLTDFFITDYAGIYALGIVEAPAVGKEPLTLQVQPVYSGNEVSFSISGVRQPATLSVFDKLGRKVYSTETDPDPSGTAVVNWGDKSQPSGVYFVRVDAGAQTKTGKFVMMR